MIKKTVDGLTIKIPELFVIGNETVELTASNLKPVYGVDYFVGDTPIGFNLSYETEGQGSVVNGISLNGYGEVVVGSGPLNEPEEYEHPDDAPYDTYFEPPVEFTEQIVIIEKY